MAISLIKALFDDGPEYKKRQQTPFKPTKVTITEIHAAVPKKLFEKSTVKSLHYVLRDIICATVVYRLGTMIDSVFPVAAESYGFSPVSIRLSRSVLWGAYWFMQSVVLTGWWALAHEAGHGTLSPTKWVNHAIGFSLHTFLLVPYFNWRATHQAHHKSTNSLERDVTFIPRTRTHYKLPPEKTAQVLDYRGLFDETPLVTLSRMLFMQLLGWQCYLLADVLGNPKYPAGTNLILPSSPLFKPKDREGIIMSNIGVSSMLTILYCYAKVVGFWSFLKLYLIPYLLVHHWIVMMTYLQHSDPTVPYYRGKTWTFLRGTLSTIDRPLLGPLGRFFLHNMSHNHVSHHIFSSIPFYNQPEVTEHVKKVLGDDMVYDSTNTFRALYRSFTQCCFIEDSGDIVFLKNAEGKAAREVADDIEDR